MRILFFGDIMGRAGREALLGHLPALKKDYVPDFIIANAENAAGGYGITLKIAAEFFSAGIDVLTTGNHVWDQKELLTTIHNEPRILRPLNFPKATPGAGHVVATSKSGKKLAVLHVMGRLFMEAMDCPFGAVNEALQHYALGKNSDGIFLDVHGEASSEKQAIAHHVDGRITAVIGTHTHVPTADGRILKGGTAFQTDAGMCGDYDSVIGMRKDAAVQKMIRKYAFEKLAPADGPGSVCGVCIESDDATGLARSIIPIRKGGVLG